MAQTGYTPILIYGSGTAASVPLAANMTSSSAGAELALNYADGKLYFKNSSGVVTLLASSAGASGDVVGPASATDTAVALFDGTTGKLIKNSPVTIGTTGNTVISGTDNTNAMLRITQLGTGNALLVEDSANPDSTPFVIDASGVVINGYTTAVATQNYGGSAVTAALYQQHGNTQNTSTAAVFNWSSSVASPANLILNKSISNVVGTRGALTAANTDIGSVTFNGDDGTNFIPAATILAELDGTPGTNDMPGRLVFSTTADGASTPTERMRIDSAGAVGIGSTSLTARRLVVGGNMTGSTGAYGSLTAPTVQPDVTANALISASQGATASNGGTPYTITNLVAYTASQGTFNADSTVTTQVGFNATAALIGATNNYGFQGNIASGTGRYNLYMSGTADNYLAGSLGVGSVPITTSKLYITNTVTDTANSESAVYSIMTANNASGSNIKIGNRSSVLTGASFAGTNILNAFRADITYSLASAYTGSLQGFRTSINNSGAGAVSSVYGFTSTNPGNTGGGSITNFYGFAQDDVTTATAVYGFLGSVASGANKFNLYMSGTANNYMAGNLSIGTTTSTSMLQVAGSSSVSALKTPNIAEVDTISATAATGVINYDVTTQSVLYYTTNASANWTVNFRGSSGTSLNTVMQTGESISATFLVTQGSTAYYNSAVTIDGTSVTPKWQGGTAPTSGNASSVDCYTYVIQKTGSATYVVLASQTKFA